MATKPKGEKQIPPLDEWHDQEIRRAAVEFAIKCGADKSNLVPLASTIENYIRRGMPK